MRRNHLRSASIIASSRATDAWATEIAPNDAQYSGRSDNADCGAHEVDPTRRNQRLAFQRAGVAPIANRSAPSRDGHLMSDVADERSATASTTTVRTATHVRMPAPD